MTPKSRGSRIIACSAARSGDHKVFTVKFLNGPSTSEPTTLNHESLAGAPPLRLNYHLDITRVDCPPLRPPELAGAKVGNISARGPEIKQVGALVGKKVQKLAWASILPGKGLTSRRARQKRCRARYLLSLCTRPSIRAWRSGKALAQSERSRVRFLAQGA